MPKRWNIGTKIFLALLIVGIVPLTLMGIYRIYSADVIFKEGPIGAEELRELYLWTQSYKRIFVGFFVGSVLLILILSYYITRMIIKPLKELNRGVREISSGRLDLQIPIHSYDEVGLLTDEFNRMALSLGSIRQKMIEQNRRLNTLYEAARVISSTISLPDLLSGLVNHARVLVNARYGAIGLREPDGNLKKFITSGLSTEEVEVIGSFPVGKGIIGLMLKEKRPVRIDNIGEDPRSAGFPSHHPVMKTFLGVPIIVGERVVGSYYFCEKVDGESFTKDDEDILLSLSADAALAIERAELFDRIARHEEELEKIVEERTKELKDAHEELLRKEKLAIMGQMAGSVAHEIKNPLAGIKGAIHYLKSRMKDGDKKVMEYLEMMDHEINVTSKIITDLLDFSRVRPPERQEVDIGNLVSEALEAARPADSIKVKLDLGADLPRVYIDRIQIRLVFCNIITNAGHAMMNDGGSLTIRTSIAKTGSDHKHLDISFSDTGCGIPKEHIDKIFQPLFTTKRGGIGLGLSLSKGFVEANGGKIGLESEVGKGTTFTISLPVA